jgi:hypothetical protein
MRKAYKLISDYYGDKTTERSGVKLINHIDEGIIILKSIGADDETIDAYCLHPILQSDESFNENYTLNFEGISTTSLLLAMEYRRVANSYLSTNKIEDFVGFVRMRMNDAARFAKAEASIRRYANKEINILFGGKRLSGCRQKRSNTRKRQAKRVRKTVKRRKTNKRRIGGKKQKGSKKRSFKKR